MSTFYFHRVFKTLTGVTPKDYATARRSQRVRKELSKSNTVTEAIYDAGFNSNGRFYANSSQTLGMTPTSFRSGGGGKHHPLCGRPVFVGFGLTALSEKARGARSLFCPSSAPRRPPP